MEENAVVWEDTKLEESLIGEETPSHYDRVRPNFPLLHYYNFALTPLCLPFSLFSFFFKVHFIR